MPDGPSRHYLITGCSGGGKTTLLAELARRGFTTVPEPGRRLITQGLAPWDDLPAFLRAAAAMARADLASHARSMEVTFFDRGLIDALAGLERTGSGVAANQLVAHRPYARRVFLAPPWPEIHRADRGRRHGFDEAMIEYDHLAVLLPALGYEVVELPRVPVADRADFILAAIGVPPRAEWLDPPL